MNVPIFTYHALGVEDSVIMTAPEKFAAHLDAVARAGYVTVTIGDSMKKVQAGQVGQGLAVPLGTSDTVVGAELTPAAAVIPTGLGDEVKIALTFDDGYASVYEIAYPLLRARGMTATVYVISDFVGKDNRWRGQRADIPALPLMTWDQIAELAENGWEIGAHTRTHPPLTQIDATRLEDQIAGSQWAIQAHIGRVARAFSYPYGVVNQKVKAAMLRYYDTAVTTRLGIARDTSNRLLLPRIDAYYVTASMITRLDWVNTRIGLRLVDAAHLVKRFVRHDWDERIEW